jgi:glycerate kinase
MKAIVLAPDSFKGALSALEVAEALAVGLRRVWPEAGLRLMPMADGGEGTLDAVLAATGGERRVAEVAGTDGRPVEAGWGLLRREGGAVAVLEAAQVVGLTLGTEAPVEHRGTLGLGELMRHCLDQGIRRFMIGVGGSSTNDGGCGVLAALGARLLDASGNALAATPAGLDRLDRVDFSGLDGRIGETGITLMSDVQNPLCGPLGATAVFGPQKGVGPARIAALDARLRHFADLCDAWRGDAVSLRPGTGAAGGLGYVFQLLGGRNRSGAEVVCELSGLDDALAGAGWVITGEGRSDAQTLLGKVPWVVAGHARQAGVAVTLVSGAVEEADLPRLSVRFDGCFSIAPGPMPLAQAMAQTARLLADRAEQLARLVAFAAPGMRD